MDPLIEDKLLEGSRIINNNYTPISNIKVGDESKSDYPYLKDPNGTHFNTFEASFNTIFKSNIKVIKEDINKKLQGW